MTARLFLKPFIRRDQQQRPVRVIGPQATVARLVNVRAIEDSSEDDLTSVINVGSSVRARSPTPR